MAGGEGEDTLEKGIVGHRYYEEENMGTLFLETGMEGNMERIGEEEGYRMPKVTKNAIGKCII